MKPSDHLPQREHILIAGTDRASTREICELLQKFNFQVSVFSNEGSPDEDSLFEHVRRERPDLLLLNRWFLNHGQDAYGVCIQLKEHPETQETCIILLDILDDEAERASALAAGCADYLIHSFPTQELLARVNTQLALKAAKKTIEYLEFQVCEQTAEIAATHQKLNCAITERLKIEQELQKERVHFDHHARHDPLTQLANRKLLMERIEYALQNRQNSKSRQIAILLLDLDRFKVVNESLGHNIGDQLLITIAHHLKNLVRTTDTVARLGGDEFVLLLDPIQQPSDAIRCAERIVRVMRLPLFIDNHEIFLTPSIGIAIGTSEYHQAADLLRDADIAMYRAKRSSKARYAMFNQEMYTETLIQHQMERDLRYAVEQNLLYTHFQPTVSLLLPYQLTGFEALVRWNHPTWGNIPPHQFIPLAEETGLIVPLGEWVLHATCKTIAEWQAQFELPSDFRVSVNISIKQLQDPYFLKQVNRVLRRTGVSGKRLRLELTESVFMNNPESFIPLLKALREKDIELSIDDFGTGYSSLSYLHRLPVNYIKIDRSFISRLGLAEENLAIVSTILTLARELGLGTIAEGVETHQQLEYLQMLGCDAAQGYVFAKPLPQDKAEELLQRFFCPEQSASPTNWESLNPLLSTRLSNSVA
jgi:diguanylate cyclase (GGDEF)-like protein